MFFACLYLAQLFIFYFLSLSVAPPPNITEVVAVSSREIRVSWQPLNMEDVPGVIVNYHVRYMYSAGAVLTRTVPYRYLFKKLKSDLSYRISKL